jgi:hypothetical protein
MRTRIDGRLAAAAAMVALLVLGACSWTKVENTNQQSQGQTGPTNPTASPSPSVDCAAGGMAPGAENDTHKIKPGQSIVIGVTIFGAQGIELVPSCLATYSPVWTTESGPCVFVGSHSGTVTASATATIGSVCSGRVHVPGLPPGLLEFTVSAT